MTRRRSVTAHAAGAAIEQGRRMLRLPTIRDRFAEIAAAAEPEQLSYLGFLSDLVIAECDDRARGRAKRRIRDIPAFHDQNGWRSPLLMSTPQSTPPASGSWPPARGLSLVVADIITVT
ncbi:transposition helper domain protein [Mycobacterium kansasii 732]|uniref:Uncharacterized protein n=1 Tax=Mycobacterium pseudokansasii TaxID=2341080 RepID=A0A498QWX4_9MYCO|nr:hypothetical protein [Mycobacterium pseudokansasii]EUA12891.1 transposition helper domain protein [Mycobacterium kansasii 732]VAZ97969.1 hypothetical protein LAUMK35_03875 [Mycobacterium pseudokansasii]VBA52921.1 hypothetical protein LAUMK142_03769 [Mycobacterium pseudokansasii]